MAERSPSTAWEKFATFSLSNELFDKNSWKKQNFFEYFTKSLQILKQSRFIPLHFIFLRTFIVDGLFLFRLLQQDAYS